MKKRRFCRKKLVAVLLMLCMVVSGIAMPTMYSIAKEINSNSILDASTTTGSSITVTTDSAIQITPLVEGITREGITNVALGKPATSDSQETKNPISAGNDGSATTRWCAANGNNGHWWKVDLGKDYQLTGSEVNWEQNQVYKYQILTSTDNVNWVNVADQTKNTQSAQTTTDSFSITARYVQIIITGVSNGKWASFYEFKVFGIGPELITVNDGTTGTNNNEFEFVGSWNYSNTDTGLYQNDSHWSTMLNSYYIVRFSGTKILLYGTVDPGHGIAAVSIDDGEETEVDFYSSTRQPQILKYTSPTLLEGNHILKVRVTGSKNTASSNTAIPADKVMIEAVPSAPTIPTGLSAIALTEDQINVSWKVAAGATNYDIEVDGTVISDVTSPYSHKGLVANSTHTYRVMAKNAYGNSNWSNPLTTEATPISDARGLVAISKANMSAIATSAQSGYEASNLLDGNSATLWKSSAVAPQSITINLGATYTVGKIAVNLDAPLGGRMQIYNVYTSTDGVTFTKQISKGRYSSCPMIYFDTPIETAYIKVEMLTTNDGTSPWVSEVDVYKYKTIPVITPGPNPVATTPVTNPALSLANQVLIEKGLQIHTWLPSTNMGRQFPTPSEYEGLHMTGVTYYDPPLYNRIFQQYNPGAQWNLAKAPDCNNAVGKNPPGNGDYLTSEQKANIDQLVSVCFGDEQGYSTTEEGYLKNWFAASKTLYPRVLLHTNQSLNQWSSTQLDSYIRNAKPDILTFDNYYCDQNGSIKDYNLPKAILNALNYQRPKALAGIDGTGTKPIVFGQYIGAYKIGGVQWEAGWYEYTESQKYLITNLTWAMGGKWIDMFRTEYNPEYVFLFDKNGNPTRHYYEYGELFRQSKNLGPHLVRLNNQDVRVKPGQYMSGSTITTNTAPNGTKLSAFAANTEYHISDITATNLGTQNNRLSGDVIIGYFKPLPGIDTKEFFTSENPKYFMVVNGLTQGNGLRPEQQHGSLAETQQRIKITVTNPSTLKKVNRDTGTVETVTLTPAGNDYTFDTTLGGGECELFYWEE